jgi:adenosylcobyric acid synthase
MKALMVQGCTSSAGKSLLATVLCRYFARRGLRVAPFKGQNMSNHARVGEGGELGAAQYWQALAAGVTPDARMNPVLVKPEGERHSQVVVLGGVRADLSRSPWRARAGELRQLVLGAFDSLARDYELLVIEGAGSPAEINLADSDLANLAVARHTQARVLLVADIDRGGAFAHLYGTWRLLEEPDRARIGGFVLNRFRGDPGLLPPAPERLRELTDVPTLGVIPEITHSLPEEDGASRRHPRAVGSARIAVVTYPTASNLDEFTLLEHVGTLVWARSPAALESADIVVLPGSKNVSGDLEWLRAGGFPPALVRRVAAGGRVLAICGGMQLAGRQLRDAGAGERTGDGLGLLPLKTTFAQAKRVGKVCARFAALPAPWSSLSDLKAIGYEIRHGFTEPIAPVIEALPDGLGFASGPVMGVYPHGLLENPAIVQALLGATPHRTVEHAIDELTDAVLPHLDLPRIGRLAGVA